LEIVHGFRYRPFAAFANLLSAVSTS